MLRVFKRLRPTLDEHELTPAQAYRNSRRLNRASGYHSRSIQKIRHVRHASRAAVFLRGRPRPRRMGGHHDRARAAYAHHFGGLAEFERELIRARTSEGRARRGARREARKKAEAHRASAERGAPPPRCGRADARDCADVQRLAQHDFEARAMSAN